MRVDCTVKTEDCRLNDKSRPLFKWFSNSDDHDVQVETMSVVKNIFSGFSGFSRKNIFQESSTSNNGTYKKGSGNWTGS